MGRDGGYTPAEMRSPLLAGVLAGLLVGLVALAVVVAGLQPETIMPARPTLAPVAGSPSPSPTASPSPAPTPSPSPSPTTGVAVGNRAPELKVDGVAGDEIDLAALRGKPVWVNFTASWCPTCRDELSLMQRFALKYPDLPILVIDVKEDPAVVRALVDELDIVMPVGLDRDGKAQLAWNAYALPVHFWIDGAGIVRAVVYGEPGPEEFLAGLRTVLPDATLP